MERLGEAAAVVDEVQGFRYFDLRDLLGFMDGTENPTDEAAAKAVTVGTEDADFAGASYVIVQKYLHDLRAWNGLSVEEQEKVVGRTKLANVELPDDVKPANSHVAVNTIEDADGSERQILRDNPTTGWTAPVRSRTTPVVERTPAPRRAGSRPPGTEAAQRGSRRRRPSSRAGSRAAFA